MTTQVIHSPSVEQRLQQAVAVFLPRDYPDSVSPNYIGYVQWQLAATVASSAGMVLSMQSLLYAVGLGAGSIPMAAALNWVIKDGLGQLGGVMFASFINNRFDADPKRWRMISALALDGSTLLELMSPLAPSLFLPIASVANVGKNVAWLSASATRAGIHRSMTMRENLADITGKSGSQSIAGSLIGTALGIGLSPLIGSDTAVVMSAFGVLSFVHLGCNYASLQGVVLNTLNPQRFEIVVGHFLSSSGGASGRVLLTPEEVGAHETFMLPYTPKHAKHGRVRVDSEPGLEVLGAGDQGQLSRIVELFAMQNYLLCIGAGSGEERVINILKKDGAQDSDIIAGGPHSHRHAASSTQHLVFAVFDYCLCLLLLITAC
jgi:hypothetical protein